MKRMKWLYSGILTLLMSQSPLMAQGIFSVPVPKVETEAEFQKRITQLDFKNPPLNIIFSEVCYWPKAGENEWIELKNISHEPVDIKGWRIMDGQTIDFIISEQPLVIPSKAFLVIRLDGSGRPATVFDAQMKATVHSLKGVAGNLLGDGGGQLALYSPFTRPTSFVPPIQRSFIAWGFSPGRILEEAIQGGRWTSANDVVIGSSNSEIIMGPVITIQQGGTIGLLGSGNEGSIASKRWGIFSPLETTPGRSGSGKRGPVLTFYTPDGATTDIRGFKNLSVVPMEFGVKYEFQVCRDKACTDIFINKVNEGFDYHLEKPIPHNSTYYWRARLVYPEGKLSQWSEVRRIIRE